MHLDFETLKTSKKEFLSSIISVVGKTTIGMMEPICCRKKVP